MAKKAKKAEAEAEAPEGAEAAPAPSGKKKLILLVALVAVLGGAGGGGWWFFKSRAAHKEVEAAPVKKPIAYLDLREMTVNLAPESASERQRYIKFKVSLEVKEAKVLPDVQPFVPRIEDAFQVYVRELRATDLEGSAGMYRLREELLRRVNVATYPAKVDAVLFKDIVVQ
jgi:flagellar protein FliL